MTIATWPTGPLPVLGDEKNVSFRIKNAKFGDGYEERSLYGINPKIKKGNLLFRAITTEQKNIYSDFLDGRSGIYPFYMVLPGETTPTIILVSEYKLTTIGGFYWELSMSYEQFFPSSSTPLPDPDPESSEYDPIPVGEDPEVVTTTAGAAGISLSATAGSTLSFAPITSLIGSGVDMELRLSSVVVAVVSFPSDYLSPLRSFEFYNSANNTTYTGIFSIAAVDLE
jgi:phage-related protein